jgi:hypothetical protein
MAWLTMMLIQGYHMGPAGSRQLSGNNYWPANRARMQQMQSKARAERAGASQNTSVFP